MLSIGVPFDALENFANCQEIRARTELFQVMLESCITCSFDLEALKHEAGGKLRNPSILLAHRYISGYGNLLVLKTCKLE